MPIYEKLMGNPFVDAGICGICEWLGRSVQPEQITTDDLEQVVNDIVPIMRPFNKNKPEAHGWKNRESIFTRNHELTNGKEINRIPRFKKMLLDCIEQTVVLGERGDCLGCGRRDASKPLLRHQVPLTGSGSLRNFFPAFDDGSRYCFACAFAIQMSPLVFMATGGKFLTLHSNSWKALRSWARVCVEDIRRQQLQQEITGCHNPGYANPRNGMFYMARKMAQYQEMRTDENMPMQVYYFRNFGQEPELEIFYMPASVFKFLRIAYMGKFNTAWQEIVRAGYGKINWDKVESEDDYKNRINRVYENLLQDISILGFFLNRRIRKPRGNWELLSLYLKEVRNMERTRREIIKQVGDHIADCIQESNTDKRLYRLERANSYEACRNVLLYIIRERIKQGAPNPLFSLDDYMEHLFPESEDSSATKFGETRDLLLFRIYERLHNWLQEKGFVDFDENNTSDADDLSETEANEED